MEITGVRLDSGDLTILSRKVRSLLPNLTIFASGDLDEWEIQRLKKEGASIDGYGIGNRMVCGKPVNGVYKLVEIDGIPTMKKSSHKATYPGRKQIFRQYVDQKIAEDYLVLADETPNRNQKPLLELVMKQGEVIPLPESLETIKKRTYQSVESLPIQTRQLNQPTSIPVNISSALESVRKSLDSP